MRLASTLILSFYPTRTIEFFLKIYPYLLETSLSCKDMAEVYGRTPQAVIPHIRTLTEGGCLSRDHYRAWSLGPLSQERTDYAEKVPTEAPQP